MHFVLDQTEQHSCGYESIILIHSENGGEDTPENIHLPSLIDDESSDIEKMEKIFSSRRKYHDTYKWTSLWKL